MGDAASDENTLTIAVLENSGPEVERVQAMLGSLFDKGALQGFCDALEGTVIAVAKRLSAVVRVGRPAGRAGGAYYVTVLPGCEDEARDIDRLFTAEAKEARRSEAGSVHTTNEPVIGKRDVQ
jgi:hypothetical protein